MEITNLEFMQNLPSSDGIYKRIDSGFESICYMLIKDSIPVVKLYGVITKNHEKKFDDEVSELFDNDIEFLKEAYKQLLKKTEELNNAVKLKNNEIKILRNLNIVLGV